MAKELSFGDVKVTYLGHSGFIMTKGKYSIVVDPFLTDAPMAVKKPEDISAEDILITHGHADHIGDAVQIAINNHAKITSTFEIAKYCQEQGADAFGVPIGVEQLFEWGKAIFRPALHSGLLPNGQPFDISAGIIFDFGNIKIYHLGDTAINNDFKLVQEIYKPDVALIPIGGRVNLDIDQACLVAQWLGVKTVIPMHYDLYTQGKVDPEDFKKKIESLNAGIECIIMEP